MITLGGYLLFSGATINTGARIVIQLPDGEVEADPVGVIEADIVGEVPAEVECG